MPNAPHLRTAAFDRVGRRPLHERATAHARRQWAFVKDGWAFMVVSVLHADHEAKILPEVRADARLL